MLAKEPLTHIRKNNANIMTIIYGNAILIRQDTNITAIAYKKNAHQRSRNYKQYQFSCNHQENMSKKMLT